MSKQQVFCDLIGLKGIKKRRTNAIFIKEANVKEIKSALESGYACTSAGDNGAINIWKTDAGILRGETMRHCCSIECVKFSTYAEAIEWAQKWLPKIN